MKKQIGIGLVIGAMALTMGGCWRTPKVTRTDTETSGFARIGADEGLEPVIREELAVFTGLHPEAQIEARFLSEPELFAALMSDSLRLIVAAKEPTQQQLDSLKKLKLTPRVQRLAIDGIALIINKENTDSLIDVQTVRRIMTGELTDWKATGDGKSKLGEIRVVFDNPNSSTLRFVQDSIVGAGKPLGAGLRALQTNAAVIDFVSRTPNALGVIGKNWISNMRDSSQLKFDEAIRVMAVGREAQITEDNTYKPFPAFLSNGSYPFRREIFVILTDYRETLPAGFVKFAAGEAGQRIILRAGLVPATLPTREVEIKHEF